MHPPTPLLFTTLAALLLTLPTACERPTQPQSTGNAPATNHSETNAADEYRSLRAAMDLQLVAQLADAKGELSPALEQSVLAAKPVIDRLVWATSLPRCDWGIDYAAGFDTDLPHLKDIRTLAQLVRADAQRALRARDTASAAADIAALVNLSKHVGGKAIIEPLVAFGVLKYATDLTTEHASRWTADDRSLIRAALRKIDPDDPHGGSAAMEWDKRLAAREGVDPPDEVRFRQTQEQIRAGLRAALSAVE